MQITATLCQLAFNFINLNNENALAGINTKDNELNIKITISGAATTT